MRLGDSQQVELAISAKDKAGNDAPIQAGSVVVTSSDAAILAVAAGADENHPLIQAVGALGSASVSVSADADLGDGVTTIMATSETVDVVAGPAVGLGLAFGAPTDKP